ncbi:MAG: pseudouridine synthase [Sediminispirochaetaceae bacterium]
MNGSNWKAMSPEEQEEQLRLQVYLSRCGIASRRKCEDYIAAGRVTVNGTVVTRPGSKVGYKDDIRFDGRLVEPERKSWYIALNKPPGYLCSQYDREGRRLAVDLLKSHFNERLYNVGRLDFFSEGLIFFTNDGDFAATVSHPSSGIEKDYRIELYDPVVQSVLDTFLNGVSIDNIVYRIERYRIVTRDAVNITLVEGKNRELRILMDHAGWKIRKLIRLRIGPVHLDTLESGSYRLLTNDEVHWFMNRKKR